MNLFYISCEKCNTKIRKFDGILDIVSLKSSKVMKCKSCGTEYAVPRIIKILGTIYNWSFIWALILIYIVLFLYKFDEDLGILAWFIALIIYLVFELIVTAILPINKKEGKD